MISDILIITEIYGAREKPISGVSGELISEERLMEVPNATKSVINKEKKKLNLI